MGFVAVDSLAWSVLRGCAWLLSFVLQKRVHWFVRLIHAAILSRVCK